MAERVYAVEVDPDLAAALCGRVPNVQVINADALTVELPDYNKIVSNLPYQISSKITYRLLSRPFELAVLMFQREFVQRMMAPRRQQRVRPAGDGRGLLLPDRDPGERSKTAFRPVPEVDSAIVRLRPRKERQEVDTMIFMRLVEALFRNRRKKVKKALAAFGVSKETLAELDATLLKKAGGADAG